MPSHRYTGVARRSRSPRRAAGASSTRMLNAAKRCVFLDSTAGATGGHPPVNGSGFAPLLRGDGRILPNPSSTRLGRPRASQALHMTARVRFVYGRMPAGKFWNDFGIPRRHRQSATSEAKFSGRRPRGPNMRSSCRGTAMTRGGASCREDRAKQLRPACASPVPPADFAPRLPVPARRRLVPPSGG